MFRRKIVRILLALLLLLAILYAFGRRTPAPALAPGVTKEHLRLTLAGQIVSVTLYRPAKDDNAPLVVVAHGFSRAKRYMSGWGAELAAQGFLAVVPTQPALVNHEINSSVLAALVEQYREKRRVALVGFSMGGHTTLLAAQKTPVDAWLGLDPVDMDGTAKTVAAKMKMPSAILCAEPEMWNMRGNAAALIAALPGPKFTLQVTGSTHLDAEWPPDLIGQIACGFVTPQYQSTFRRYAIAFLQATLRDDAQAKATLQKAITDAALTKVTVSGL
ncbi:MAG: alpha/beta fold hydrolase [Verrucomicrobiota bacterium]